MSQVPGNTESAAEMLLGGARRVSMRERDFADWKPQAETRSGQCRRSFCVDAPKGAPPVAARCRPLQIGLGELPASALRPGQTSSISLARLALNENYLLVQ